MLEINMKKRSFISSETNSFILWYKDISSKDVPLVGGKNASLGEMFSSLTGKGLSGNSQRINVSDGFALTANAYWYFISENKLKEKLKLVFQDYNPNSINSLQKTGRNARAIIIKARIPEDLKKEIIKNYRILEKKYGKNVDVAVRSSGIAEDSPTTSFAGQFETYLNIK